MLFSDRNNELLLDYYIDGNVFSCVRYRWLVQHHRPHMRRDARRTDLITLTRYNSSSDGSWSGKFTTLDHSYSDRDMCDCFDVPL